jgi:hypothetical protein
MGTVVRRALPLAAAHRPGRLRRRLRTADARRDHADDPLGLYSTNDR